jgi:histidinol-phosphatase (PHP family)
MGLIDRQGRDLPLDAHVHTRWSHDSDVELDDHARRAVDLGIAELAITDHVDFAPSAPGYGSSTFAERERAVREAALRWADEGLAIRFGAEITWDSAWAEDIRRHLDANAYDFVIGSVHIYRDSPYAAANVAGWVAGRSLAQIVAPYFAEVRAAARSGLFDVIGHLDFVKRFLVPHVTAADLADAPELYEPMLDALLDSGTGLEVNTSGLRSPAEETFPSSAIVARFHAKGGTAVTVGSDAHLVDSLAWALQDGYDSARDAGFTELTFRRGGARVPVPMPSAPNVTAGRSL